MEFVCAVVYADDACNNYRFAGSRLQRMFRRGTHDGFHGTCGEGCVGRCGGGAVRDGRPFDGRLCGHGLCRPFPPQAAGIGTAAFARDGRHGSGHRAAHGYLRTGDGQPRKLYREFYPAAVLPGEQGGADDGD